MRVAVLGAGVVGVATAYQLLEDGHDVTVLDRAEAPASFTSHANAGLVAPGHAYAWSSPAAPGMMLRSLWRRDQAIRLRPRLSPRQWSWLGRFVGQCNVRSTTLNSQRKAVLCVYSQAVLRDVVARTGVRYDGQRGGLVYFYRTQRAFEAAAEKCRLLRERGIEIEVLERAGVLEKDPGLAGAAEQIAGALYAPQDESGDARLFTVALAEHCGELGVQFRYGTQVRGLRTEGDSVTELVTSHGVFAADAFVVCLGVYSPHLVEQLGIRLPIYPVKGYSATLAITDAQRAPRLGGVDEENLLAYCPLGSRLRLTATAEIAGYSTTHRPADFRAMLARARALFDGAADFGAAQLWAGLRPMTPTGLPVIDRSPYTNLWLNTGHGHMGWTMANGSARVLADLLGQRQPAIDREGMRNEP